MGLITKIFGTRSQRELKRIQPMVDSILALEETYAALSEEELKGKTAELKERLAQGETLDDILVDAFAAVREAAWRVLGMKPYPVQLIGGIILHQGRIAEMKTGEGKTLVAILPCYLNALTGRGVHVVTVNDYLAKRDSEWMGKVYRYMGLTVGLIIPGMTPAERRVSYAADITYCTNNELGFDYLRDNMAIYQSELVQRGHAFAIVDEVDSILIDEARTPLIISGKGEESSQLYQMADNFVSGLRKKVFAKTEDKEVHDDYDCDYFVDEKSRTVSLTATGIAKAEKFFGVENLADTENTTLSHHINQAMKARGLMKKDIDYVVKEGQIIIVDEFTGRLMYGRRYNEGLHQAIEAKEKVTVAGESKTLATITFQNFFRLYDKLSGMTGTALTEEEEFATIYKLDVVEIPTNRPIARVDRSDVVYKTEAAKFRAIIQQVKQCHAKGQPVLVGTISIERSELLSKLLKKEGIPHNVLNAKYHEMEAQIVAQAGKFGAVTIATNMAGRGTDIVLGGNAEFLAKTELRKEELPEELLAEADSFAETQDPEILAIREKYEKLLQKHKAEIADEAEKVRQAGGLFIIGTERHESRRIDNQLRGRSGRQGDPGESRFYLSMQDDLMRLFSSDRIMGMMDMLRLEEDMPIDAKILSGAVENAQKAVESRHFRSRKSVLEFDDVMNTQRGIIYAQRQKVLSGEDLRDNMLSMLREVILGAEEEELTRFEGIFYPVGSVAQNSDPDALCELAEQAYERKEADLTPAVMREAERVIMLRVVDEYWMDHIDAMDDLKQGIGLRAYGQHDPVIAYKEEGFAMFEAMVTAIREETVRRLMLVQIRPQQELRRQRVAKETGTAAASQTTVKKAPVRNKDKKVGPNEPCPCGSGKKYKKCCMQKEKLQ
ncbi:MAG: preprotein translocase subunit SecA [Oscillospiraceae bacterium]|nr:preprotein translocase subunit SecA [Oscillospiraceae bacterium]